jgi:uncharacterized protein
MSYTYLDLAEQVLQGAKAPMIYQDIWKEGVAKGFDKKLAATGKTPWQSVGARLYIEIRDNPDSEFIGVGKRPMRFFLKSRKGQLPADAGADPGHVEAKADGQAGAKQALLERELHKWLAYFAYTNPTFNRGRRIFTKTIFHEKSTKGGFNKWIHPDMVGFYVPFEDWEPNVLELNRLSDNDSLRLFSFELKRSLNKSNYREAFFQAVSNSSWSHEGYLVAADILEDDDFLAEIERLNSAFGIGVIQLDIDDVDASKVLFAARLKEALDWETINKLCEQNTDFAQFLRNVRVDFDAREVHPTKYDEIPPIADSRQR